MNTVLSNKIISTQHIGIVIIFTLFYFVKTQFYNVVIYTTDLIMYEGKISEIFTYNYTGQLIGCEEVLDANKTLGDNANVFYSLNPSIVFSISIMASMLFIHQIKRLDKRVNITSWILLAIFSFFLFDALDFLFYNLTYIVDMIKEGPPRARLMLIMALTTVFIAIVLFFKFMNNSTKLQLLFLGLPCFFIGFFLWNYIGSMVMPIIILE